jgi:hypothetical protein
MEALDTFVPFEIAGRVFVFEKIVSEREAALHLDPLGDLDRDRDLGVAIVFVPASA